MREIYEPFDNAEEVWFWFCRSLDARGDGLRSRNDYPGKCRSIEIGDVSRILKRMRARGEITTVVCASCPNGGCSARRRIMTAEPNEAK